MRVRDGFFWLVSAGLVWAFVTSVFSSADRRKHPAVPFDAEAIRPVALRVDQAFEQIWREHDLRPAESASDLAIARRISLALTGTIPSLEEIRRFERLDNDSDKRDRLDHWLAERLADRRYADHVAERLARAYVGVEDGPFLLYRRRRFVAWLADQLAANQPYDVLVRHLIADSGLWTDTPATNFITVTIDPGQNPDPKRLAARTARAFLGVRLDCAECHDHPFESWKQHDFQALAAFFSETRQGLRGIRDMAGEARFTDPLQPEAEPVACAVPFSPELLSVRGMPRARLAEWVTHPDNRPFAREAVNRAWALLFGRPLVEPIDNLPIAGTFPAALDILADDFVEHDYNWQRLLKVIASTRVFRLDSKLDDSDGATLAMSDTTPGEESSGEKASSTAAGTQHDVHWAVFPLSRLRPEQVVGALLQSASLSTIDASSHILVRIARFAGQNEFVVRYGDVGAEEFDAHGGTIPQRLLMMNGKIVAEKTKEDFLGNAATRIAALAPTDAAAVETAMLAVLTRRPTAEESRHFTARLAKATRSQRAEQLGDLYWSLLNGTEFSWNH